ncbi:hypothetical protein M1N55_07035 [Dehalococcoidia bacterium]|nr:hypothetical protein [Dehalococcoidia bacterium]
MGFVTKNLFKKKIPLIITLFAVISIFGCSVNDHKTSDVNSINGETRDQVDGKWLISQPNSFYTFEDLIAAGWKKSDQLSTETLESATDAWYGFYKQKDIEIRFYKSHKEAREFGIEPAVETINKSGGARDGAHAVWTPNISMYGAYAVVGNLVMMCELELGSCESLIDALQSESKQ